MCTHTIKCLGPGDEDLLQGLASLFYEGDLNSDVARKITSSHHTYMICVMVEDHPVGLCYFHYLQKWYRNVEEVLIYDLEVVKERRRQGFGTQMFEHVRSMAAKRMVEKIWLLVRKDNAGAREFYQSMGGKVRTHGDLCITFSMPY